MNDTRLGSDCRGLTKFMTTYEFAAIIRRFLDAFSDDKTLFMRLRRLADAYDEIRPEMVNAVTNHSSNSASAVGDLDTISNAIRTTVGEVMRETPAPEWFAAVRDSVTAAKEFEGHLPDISDGFAAGLEEFQDVFGTYTYDQTSTNAAEVLLLARSIYSNVSSLKKVLSGIKESLVPEPEIAESDSRFTISFEGDFDLRDLSLQLSSLAELHSLFVACFRSKSRHTLCGSSR